MKNENQKKIDMLQQALKNYESMLNSESFNFMHNQARAQIKKIKQELKELEEDQ